MMILVLVGVLVILVGILALEVNQPDAALTKALRNWQTGLGALIGLIAVAVSVYISASEADRLQREQAYHEGLAIALSMNHEAFRIRRWLAGINDLFVEERDGKDADFRTSPAKDWQCELFFSLARRTKYDDPGIIDSHRFEVGKLPDILGLHYLDLRSLQRELLQRLSDTTDEDCRRDPALEFAVVKENMDNIRTTLTRIDAAMATLPEVQLTTVRYR